jgi:hypothetical protein
MTRRTVTLVRRTPALLAALVLATSVPAPAATGITLTYENVYSFAPSCDLSQPLAFISVIATNAGGNGSAPSIVQAADAAGTLGGTYALPALPPHASDSASIPLRRLGATNPATLAGPHQISISVGTTRIGMTLQFPAALCAGSDAPSPAPGGLRHGSLTTGAVTGVKRIPTPTPLPIFKTTTTANGGLSKAALLALAPPSNVRSVASGTDCGAHVGPIGALVCPDMMKSGDLLLIWDWQPGDGPDAIDGYRVYTGNGINVQTGAFAGRLVATRPGKDVTLFDVPKPPGGRGYAGNCYAVTVYAGSRESKPSAAFCSGGDNIAKTETFTPVRERSVSRHTFGGGAEKSPDVYNGPGVHKVGYNYAAIKGGLFADSGFTWISRYAMLFDVRRLIGRKLVEAHLTLTVRPAQDTQPDCTNSVAFGTSDWWNESWPEGQFGPASSTLLGGQLKVEATNIVSIWIAGRFNQGIILRNDDENLRAFTNKKCETYYTNPVLSITYY